MASTSDLVKDLFCGCLSGWGQVVTMLPFENIKIKMIANREKYPNIMGTIKTTIKEEGILAFYKGMLMPLLGVGAQVSLQFGVVETLKKHFKTKYANIDGSLDTKYTVVSGFFAGIPSAVLATPFDHARFRVSLSVEKGMGSIRMAQHLLSQYGVRGLCRGFVSTLVRQCIGLSAYFGAYDFLMKYGKTEKGVNLSWSLLSGGLAGLALWGIVYPIDYIKTLLQTDSMEAPKYKSTTDCFRKTAALGDISVFYTGFKIMAARAVVINAVGFLCFELGKQAVYDQK